jgi:hypothetical protein
MQGQIAVGAPSRGTSTTAASVSVIPSRSLTSFFGPAYNCYHIAYSLQIEQFVTRDQSLSLNEPSAGGPI